LKSCCFFQDHYDDERDKTVFHNTTPDLQDQDQDRFFLVSDRSYPKTDGLDQTTSLVVILNTDGQRGMVEQRFTTWVALSEYLSI